MQQSQVKNLLRNYLRRLTNLSGNNRSLFLLRLYAEQLIDLHEFNHLNGFKSFDIISALIAGRDFRLCPVLDSRMESSNVASNKLKKLQRTDHFLNEERGSNDLHVGWPFVRGKFSDGTPVRCPLLFFPVTVVVENNAWYLKPRLHAGVTLNKTFLLAFSHYNKVKLEEELLETNFEDFNIDSTAFRTELYQLLKDKIELNFNADNFRDELSAFKVFKRNDFDTNHQQGQLKLFPEAVLGIFPQAGSQLVPDYLELLQSDEIKDLEEFFTSKTDGENVSDAANVREEKLFTPFPLDAYQEQAITSVKQGRSIVVQGPPGTGKSQLICNLIADAMASGKRALVVCQKRAALDVVYDRLRAGNLAEFVGLVHDFRNERKNIFSKIARQIDSIDDFQSANRSIDIIQTERRFVQVCRNIDHITEELEQFKQALFNDEECGLSIKELYLTSDLNGEAINVRQEYRDFPFSTLEAFLKKLRQYNMYAALLEGEDHLWRDRKSFATHTLSDLRTIENIVNDIPAYQFALTKKIQSIIPVNLNVEEAESFSLREEDIREMLGLLKNDTIYEFFKAMVDESDDETSLLWFSNTERVVLNVFEGEGVESSLSSDKLGEFQHAFHKLTATRGNIFRRIRWELTSKDKVFIKRVFIANQLPFNAEGMEMLEQRLDNRLNLEHHLTSIKGKAWLVDLPAGYDLSSIKTWFTRQKLAMRAKLALNAIREVRKSINVRKYARVEFITMMEDLLKATADVSAKKNEWSRYLSSFQIRKLIYDPELAPAFVKSLRADFEKLIDYDRLKESLTSNERALLDKLYEAKHNRDHVAHEALLQNSLRLAWIEHIESKFPYLRNVSSMRMEEQQRELLQLVEEKQKLSHDILLSKAREKVYDDVVFNRLNNRVTYRDLHHQVTKKKKIWPLRKLMAEFSDEVFRVLPCWMASPESVSAIFPMKEMFDIVIFDEASQCFAERGIPAMYRGKQLVVAGDDKQLKPNELYQIRWEEDNEDIPELEVDSLLDLSERYLPTVHLQGHYRSQSMELIDFSNKHFYEGRLKLLPDRNILNLDEPAIEYHNVGGIWHDNQNEIEAKAVVDRVVTLLQTKPGKEIGIVTFNAPQQSLIQDMLEQRAMAERLTIPASLFIKNIENVQGDEKDIIIFSVGYAPDKDKKMRMQFGSLSMAGGENRLNVAVTRAREKIILVCSIHPEEIRVDDIRNEGPRLLRDYLAFAREVYERKYKPHVEPSVSRSWTWYLNEQLRQWSESRFENVSFNVNRLPLADLHFSKGDKHLGIIMTDDARYYSSLSVKDSFAYVPNLLQQRNWDYHMVFSRNLWQDREKVQDNLMRFIGTKVLADAEN